MRNGKALGECRFETPPGRIVGTDRGRRAGTIAFTRIECETGRAGAGHTGEYWHVLPQRLQHLGDDRRDHAGRRLEIVAACQGQVEQRTLTDRTCIPTIPSLEHGGGRDGDTWIDQQNRGAGQSIPGSELFSPARPDRAAPEQAGGNIGAEAISAGKQARIVKRDIVQPGERAEGGCGIRRAAADARGDRQVLGQCNVIFALYTKPLCE